MKDLQSFVEKLKKHNQLVVVNEQISSYLELTEIQTRLLENNGPALLCTNVVNKEGVKSDFPVLVNLFGSKERFLLGINKTEKELEELAELLAFLRQPKPPKNLKDSLNFLPIVKKVLKMSPNVVSKAKCQEIIYKGEDVNLDILPIQYCFPNEPAPLITWGVTVTHGPSYKKANQEDVDDFNLGIYRLQKLSKNKLIMRWLAHRGGAQQFARWQKEFKGQDMPCSVFIGADPQLILAAVTPTPDNLSEYKFAGLLKENKVDIVKSVTNDIMVPANAEIVLEGVIKSDEVAEEGPYADHTGYYNEVASFPVFEVKAITMRKKPVYLSTITKRPPDEPSVLGECLNILLIPMLKQQFPEIHDFYLLPDACSYRTAHVSIKKLYAGQSKRVMMGIWSFLRQFMYTKLIIVVDEDLDVKSHSDIAWAISTNVDAKRDVTIIENTPIDYLDFASPVSGLGSKMGIDATTKIDTETTRQWGRKIYMEQEVVDKVDKIWESLGIEGNYKDIWNKKKQ